LEAATVSVKSSTTSFLEPVKEPSEEQLKEEKLRAQAFNVATGVPRILCSSRIKRTPGEELLEYLHFSLNGLLFYN